MRKHLLGLAMAVPLSLGTAHAAPILLIVAGGGGGGSGGGSGISPPATNGSPGQNTIAGSAGTLNGGAGGAGGQGGANGSSTALYGGSGGGGAGYASNGMSGSPDYNGQGGDTGPDYSGGSPASYGAASGGFGGGGGAGRIGGGGGGGGYSGGGGGGAAGVASGSVISGGGGGGGSYADASLTASTIVSGFNGSPTVNAITNDGFIIITPLGGLPVSFAYKGAMQTYQVAVSNSYSFTVDGAQGGDSRNAIGGFGAQVTATDFLNAGSILELIVAGAGALYGPSGGGGGGGSFVLETYAAPAPISTAIPEPATLALLGTGMIGLLAARRKRDMA